MYAFLWNYRFRIVLASIGAPYVSNLNLMNSKIIEKNYIMMLLLRVMYLTSQLTCRRALDYVLYIVVLMQK